ncbi:hypothetical protein Tco_1564151 [Tanacetum coccineum]
MRLQLVHSDKYGTSQLSQDDQNMAARLATTMFNSLKGRPIQGRFVGFVGKPVAYEELKKRFETYVNDKNSAMFPVDIIKIQEQDIVYVTARISLEARETAWIWLKERKEKIGIRIATLQQLVSPYGKRLAEVLDAEVKRWKKDGAAGNKATFADALKRKADELE